MHVEIAKSDLKLKRKKTCLTPIWILFHNVDDIEYNLVLPYKNKYYNY